jgi:hypothetical protein
LRTQSPIPLYLWRTEDSELQNPVIQIFMSNK